ncbi:MAG: YcxB family protein [Lachnospiraceae bacterium]|nr:YcxB family protein [Lachnospiraceae bacterium]
MRVTVYLNDEDYIAYNINHQFGTKSGKDAIMLGKLLHVILCIGVIIFICTLDAGPILTVIEIVAVIGFYVFLLITYDSRMKKRIRRKVEQIKKTGKLPYEPEATIDLNDDCIMEYTPSTTRKIEWKDIEQIRTDEEHVYLQFSSMQALLIPFRCAGDQKDPLMNLVLAKTGLQLNK